MPKIQRMFYLEVTPEQFLEACSDLELIELDMLLSKEKYQARVRNGLQEVKVISKTSKNGQ